MLVRPVHNDYEQIVSDCLFILFDYIKFLYPQRKGKMFKLIARTTTAAVQ
jgi:hypothetical protein